MLARQIVIGFGIAIIFPLLIHYGVSTFHPAPKYQSFFTIKAPLTSNTTPEERKEYQEQQRRDQEAYATAARAFARVLAMFAIPLGLAAMVVGAYLPNLSVGTGLILGGILTVTWGYWSYWSYLEDWIRFVSLLSGFALLLFVGIHKTTSRRTAATPLL